MPSQSEIKAATMARAHKIQQKTWPSFNNRLNLMGHVLRAYWVQGTVLICALLFLQQSKQYCNNPALIQLVCVPQHDRAQLTTL